MQALSFRSRQAAWAALTIAVLLALQQFVNLPDHSAAWRSLPNALHIPLFTAITLALSRARPHWQLPRISAVVLVIAILSEAIQIPTQRNASGIDLALDACGWGIAVVFLRVSSGGWRSYVALLCVVGITTAAAPTYFALRQAVKTNLLPLLFSAEEAALRATTRSNSPLQFSTAHTWDAYQGRAIAKVHWSDASWPGVRFVEPAGQWFNYATLNIDLFNPEVDDQVVTMAFAQLQHQGPSRSLRYTLTPGAQTLHIPMAEILLPDHRHTPVMYWLVHVHQTDAGEHLWIGDAWLSPMIGSAERAPDFFAGQRHVQ